MKLLAVDTSLDALSVALLRRDGERVEVASHTEILGRGHAERLMPAVLDHLAGEGVDLAAIDAFAVTIGPGSFTGIRVGVAAVRGFALATGRPAVGVSTLEAIAAEARPRAADRPLFAVLDARKDEVYVQGFSADATPLDRPVVISAARAADAVRAAGAAVVGPGAGLVVAVDPTIERCDAPATVSIEVVARLALARLDACGSCARPAPLYVRPADAKPQDGARLARLTPQALLTPASEGGRTR